MLLLIPILLGCAEPQPEGEPPPTDTDKPEALTFTESEELGVLSLPEGAQSFQFLPMGTRGFVKRLAAELEAPEPPYEVQSVIVGLLSHASGYDGIPCDATANVTLGVWTGAEDPTSLNKRRAEFLGSGEVTESTYLTEQEDLAHATVVLDPPVLVESGERLFVGLEPIDEAGNPLACVIAYQTDEETVSFGQWNEDAWAYAEGLEILLGATVGHTPAR